jgi:hypothetical protein
VACCSPRRLRPRGLRQPRRSLSAAITATVSVRASAGAASWQKFRFLEHGRLARGGCLRRLRYLQTDCLSFYCMRRAFMDSANSILCISKRSAANRTNRGLPGGPCPSYRIPRSARQDTDERRSVADRVPHELIRTRILTLLPPQVELCENHPFRVSPHVTTHASEKARAMTTRPSVVR